MNTKKILQQTIDLHVHIGPEIIPRKFNLPELIKYEKSKLKGIGIKNHFFPTVAMNRKNKNPFIVDSVTLNNYVGGFNPNIVRASAELSENSIIVWFPTLHAKKFLQNKKFEIPKEWIAANKREQIKFRPANSIKPLSILDSIGEITQEARSVLLSIKECGAILGTGHLPWEESLALVKFASTELNIKKIILTHPIYRKINMPVETQKELAKFGAKIEHCYSMFSIDKIAIAEIAAQIKEVGAKNCILSSDVGQSFSKSPSEALADFINLLEKEGIEEEEIITMLIKNPNNLIE